MTICVQIVKRAPSMGSGPDPNDRTLCCLHTSHTNFKFPLSLPFVHHTHRLLIDEHISGGGGLINGGGLLTTGILWFSIKTFIYPLLSDCRAYPGLTICRVLFFFVADWLICCAISVGCIGSGNSSASPGLAVTKTMKYKI